MKNKIRLFLSLITSIVFSYFIYNYNDFSHLGTLGHILAITIFMVISFVILYLTTFLLESLLKVAIFVLKLIPKIFVSFFKMIFLITLFEMHQESNKKKGIR